MNITKKGDKTKGDQKKTSSNNSWFSHDSKYDWGFFAGSRLGKREKEKNN